MTQHKLSSWPSAEEMYQMHEYQRRYWNLKRRKHGLPPIYKSANHHRLQCMPTESELLLCSGNKRAYWNRYREQMELPRVKKRRIGKPYDELTYSGKWGRDIRDGKRIRKPNSRTRNAKPKTDPGVIRRINVTRNKQNVVAAPVFKFPGQK